MLNKLMCVGDSFFELNKVMYITFKTVSFLKNMGKMQSYFFSDIDCFFFEI